MIINATLLVQIIHFGVTYVILTRVLLYPAVRMLLREDAVHERILHDISDLQQRAHDYEEFRKQQWRGCVQSLAQRKPSGPYVPYYRVLDIDVEEMPSIPEDGDITKQVRDIIIERASGD